jgi:predicted Zn-dependent peptidase
MKKDDEYGLTHLIEHMLFKDHRRSEIIKSLEIEGAEINAFTYKEYVCFEMFTAHLNLSTHLDQFLQLFLNPSFNELDFEREREVIAQELHEEIDDHQMMGLEYLVGEYFGPAYGHPVGGNIKDVRKFTFTKMKKYFSRNFKSNKIILSVISGENYNINKAFVKNLNTFPLNVFNQKLYRLKPTKAKSHKFTKKLKQEKTIESASLFFQFSGPAIFSEQYFHFLILDQFLTEGLSALLFRKLREERSLIYSLGSSLNAFQKEGNYILFFNVHPENLKETTKVLKEVLLKLDEELTNKVLEQIKARIILDYRMAMDSMDFRNELIADAEIYQVPFDVEYYFDQINQVKYKNLIKIFKLFKPSEYSTLQISKRSK